MLCPCRFEHPKFFAECSRVLKPGGTLAAWGYGYPRCQGNEQVTDLIADFGDSDSKMGPYWAPERRHIDEEYANIEPDSKHFHEVKRSKLVSPCTWTIDALVRQAAFVCKKSNRGLWPLMLSCTLHSDAFPSCV